MMYFSNDLRQKCRNAVTCLMRCDSGLALIEFVIILPVMILLAYGAYEVNRFININQKLESTAYQLADMITNNRSLTENDVDVFLRSAEVIMRPYYVPEMSIIITSFHQPVGGTPITAWQRSMPAGLTSSLVSSGLKGDSVNLNYIMTDLDQMIAVEIYYPYETLLNINYINPADNQNREFLEDDELYKVAFARSRFGALLDLF